jgi:hypothetical protein
LPDLSRSFLFSNYPVSSDYLIVDTDDVHVTFYGKLICIAAVLTLLASLRVGFSVFFSSCSKTYR